MRCPNCGKKTKVQETRPHKTFTLRYRKCPACKVRFRTREILDDEFIKYREGENNE